jgi:hypothetical protein
MRVVGAGVYLTNGRSASGVFSSSRGRAGKAALSSGDGG